MQTLKYPIEYNEDYTHAEKKLDIQMEIQILPEFGIVIGKYHKSLWIAWL